MQASVAVQMLDRRATQTRHIDSQVVLHLPIGKKAFQISPLL